MLKGVAEGLNLPAVGLDQLELGALVLVPTKLMESLEQMVLGGPAFMIGVGVMVTVNVPLAGLHPACETVAVSVTVWLVGLLTSVGAGL